MLFAQLLKVDERRRVITGRATSEAVDADNEQLDYFSSKPNFERWSSETQKRTGNASAGNLRAMHSNVAAGKITAMHFDDINKTIDIEAHIVDDDSWKKVISGVYSGLSIGGRVARKWSAISSGRQVQRYTAVPSEISLVDSPCNPDSRLFDVYKADGSVARVAFENARSAPDPLAAFKVALSRPRLWTPDTLANLKKVTLPGESADVDDNAPLPDAGGEPVHAGEQGVPSRRVDSFTRPQSHYQNPLGSVAADKAGSVTDSGQQAMDSIEAIKMAHKRPLARLPGSTFSPPI